MKCLESRSRAVRRATVRLLRLIVEGCGQTVLQRQVPNLVGLLRHPEWGVRCVALETLKLAPDAIDQACATRLVLQLQHPDWGLRHVALEAIAALEPEVLTAVAVQARGG